MLTWIIDGWKDYRRRGGLDEPHAVLVATDDYKDDSDAVGRFIKDECRTGGAQSAATTQTLYARWERWAAQDGCLSLSRIAFGRALDAKGYPAEKNTHDRLRRGICLKSQVEENSDRPCALCAHLSLFSLRARGWELNDESAQCAQPGV